MLHRIPREITGPPMYMWVGRNVGRYPCPEATCTIGMTAGGGHHGCAERFLGAKFNSPDYESVYWCECYLCRNQIAKHYFVSPRNGHSSIEDSMGDILCNRCKEGNCPQVGE